MEDDEMDSLFEGMVLFNPSQIPSDPPPPPPPLSPSPPPPPPLSSSSSSAPLDEDLFSDLTLIAPPDAHSLDSTPLLPSSTKSATLVHPTPVSSSSSVSRQVSRKKKKAGLRIGYGRDTSTASLSEEHSPSIPSIEDAQSEKSNFEDSQSEIPLSVGEIDSEVVEKCDFEDTQIQIPASVPAIEGGSSEKDDLEEEEETSGENGLVIPDNEEDVGTSDGFGFTEEMLEQIRDQISKKLQEVREMASSVYASRKELARKRRKAAENVNVASLKYKEMERELEEACEAEDFEKAERVSESLAAAEKEKEGYLNALRDSEADCDAFELMVQDVFELQIATEEEGMSSLQKFANDAEDNANMVMKNAEEVSSKETNELLSSIEALEVKKIELEIESHLINDARLGLSDSIEHVIEDDRREQEILYKKRDLLKEELEKLLALVRQKESEIVENDSNIEAVEKKISCVVSGFHDVQSSIDTKYYDTQSLISMMDSESKTLSKKKKEIENFLFQEIKRGQELKKLASVSMDEAKACQELLALRKSLALPVLKYREVKLRLGKTESKILDDVQILRNEVSAARASLQELSSARSNIQQEITSAKQRIFFIDKRSPELEAEKRVAATARNFKEAGRIASEAKALGVEKETIQTKMEADILQLGKIEEEISDTVKKLTEKEEQILLKEKEAARLGCERLRLVSATAMADRSAALELGDPEEANTLLTEAEAAETEAKQLQLAYDLKEEEFEHTAKDLISMELIISLGRKQLADMSTPTSVDVV